MKTVLVTGTFDFFHAGHLYLLKNAKKYGDRLVVVLARDKTVVRIKGRKPLHTEKERKQILESIGIVDKAILGDQKDPYKVIRAVKPDIICLGYDQQHTFALELKEELGRRGMKTKVVQLKPYAPQRIKSSKYKAAISNDSITPRQFVAIVALVVKDGKILISKRNDPANKKFHKKWEFPGGGVEHGETIHQSLRREVKEETGLKIEIGKPVPMIYMGTYRGRSGIGQLYVITYLCNPTGGRLAPHDQEVLQCRWIDPKDAKKYKMLPGNQRIIKAALPLI